jgi:hypothetical protein
MLLLAYFTACTYTYSQADKLDNAIKIWCKKNRIVVLINGVIKDNVIVKTSNYGLASVEKIQLQWITRLFCHQFYNY